MNSKKIALKKQIIKGGIGSLILKLTHAAIGFSVSITLARVLGAEGFGVYSFSLAIVMVSAIPSQVGVPQLVVRETAKAFAKNDFALVNGLWRWGNVAVGLCSLVSILIIALILFVLLLNGQGGSDRFSTIATGLALIPLIALSNVRAACLRGMRMVIAGQLPENFIRPAFFLVSIYFYIYFFNSTTDIDSEIAMILHATAAFISFAVGATTLKKVKPHGLRDERQRRKEPDTWKKAVIPLALITGMQLVNSYADIIVLGFYRTNEEVGIYRATFQIALIIIFGLQAMNQVFQPHFARLHATGEREKLQKLILYGARAVTLFALPIVVLLLIYGKDLLGVLFGSAFKSGYVALGILTVGQLVNAVMGSVGLLLNMTGNERETMKGVMIATASNIVLNLLLVPTWGLEGAAFSTASTLILWNFLLRRSVIKLLGYETLAFRTASSRT